MTLYEYLKTTNEACFDTYDTVYDACVTVDFDESGAEDYPDLKNYYLFCLEIIKKVEFERRIGNNLIVKWCDLITNNMEKFRAFTAKHWDEAFQYEDDDDEFVYQWIDEIHQYLAGNVGEKTYKALRELLVTIE